MYRYRTKFAVRHVYFQQNAGCTSDAYTWVCDLKTTPFAGYKFHETCIHSCSSYHSNPCQVVGSTPKWDKYCVYTWLFYFRSFRFLGETLISQRQWQWPKPTDVAFSKCTTRLQPWPSTKRRTLERKSYLNTFLQQRYMWIHTFIFDKTSDKTSIRYSC